MLFRFVAPNLAKLDELDTEVLVATGLDYTRYDKVVEALGGKGYWVERVDELGPALDAAFAAGVPACVNVKIAGSDFRKGSISV